VKPCAAMSTQCKNRKGATNWDLSGATQTNLREPCRSTRHPRLTLDHVRTALGLNGYSIVACAAGHICLQESSTRLPCLCTAIYHVTNAVLRFCAFLKLHYRP
jgi:hypothetical protein